jgi:hypothetical protein
MYSSIWKTPGNIPSAVINVLHKVIAVILRRNKEINLDDYVRVHNLSGDNWIIENLKKKYIVLSYTEKKNVWWIYGPDALMKKTGEVVKGKRINSRQLNQIIKRWIS